MMEEKYISIINMSGEELSSGQLIVCVFKRKLNWFQKLIGYTPYMVTREGIIKDIDLSAFNDGDKLYLVENGNLISEESLNKTYSREEVIELLNTQKEICYHSAKIIETEYVNPYSDNDGEIIKKIDKDSIINAELAI